MSKETKAEEHPKLRDCRILAQGHGLDSTNVYAKTDGVVCSVVDILRKKETSQYWLCEHKIRGEELKRMWSGPLSLQKALDKLYWAGGEPVFESMEWRNKTEDMKPTGAQSS